MSNDIIERLRSAFPNTCAQWEAADEIESLRQQLLSSQKREVMLRYAISWCSKVTVDQKQIVMLQDAATQLLGRKRPNQTDDDPRLILEIDCLNLEDALAATADLKEQGK